MSGCWGRIGPLNQVCYTPHSALCNWQSVLTFSGYFRSGWGQSPWWTIVGMATICWHGNHLLLCWNSKVLVLQLFQLQDISYIRLLSNLLPPHSVEVFDSAKRRAAVELEEAAHSSYTEHKMVHFRPAQSVFSGETLNVNHPTCCTLGNSDFYMLYTR